MQIIGITGISGSGKSSVSEKIAKVKNAYIINADKASRVLQEKGNEYYEKIVEIFGKEILDTYGNLDRKKLANLIFHDKTKKELLDNLTDEYVVPQIREEAERTSKNKAVIIDAPLLFETRLDKICDMTIGIIANEETCIKRICKRDGISEEVAKARINSQNKESFFKINCGYCINNETGENLEKQINEILSRKKFIK